MKQCLLLLLCILNLASAQTVLVDHSSENKDDLWSMGAADLMSFYLQEQGLEVVHRGQLDSMVNELSIADAEIAKSDIRKGKWMGAEFILNGSVVKTSKGLEIVLKITKTSTAENIYDYGSVFNNEDDLALGIESQSRVLSRELNLIQDNKVNVDTYDDLLDAVSILKFYKAIRLIHLGYEAEGIKELIYLTHNNPSFTLPYYWLIHFFQKYNYPQVVQSIKEKKYIDLLESENLNNSIHLIFGDNIPIEKRAQLKSKLRSSGFVILNPESIKSLDLEKDLKHWEYLQGAQLTELGSYLSEFLLKIDFSDQRGFAVTLKNSKTNKLISSYFEKQYDTLINEIGNIKNKGLDVLEKQHDKSSINNIKSNLNAEAYLLSLIRDLIHQKPGPETLWRLMGFYRTFHLRPILWGEVLARSSKEDEFLWKSTEAFQSLDTKGLIGTFESFTMSVDYTIFYDEKNVLKLLNYLKHNNNKNTETH